MIIIPKQSRFFQNISIEVNGAISKIKIPIYCPNPTGNCMPCNIKKNGHDYSVKGNPQWYYCLDCGRQFYTHTCGWYTDFQEEFRNTLVKLFEGGRYNVNQIKAELKCSNSTISRLLLQIVESINSSSLTQLHWALPTPAKVLFVDETFIKIDRSKYWLIVVVNEEVHVLAFELVDNREKDTIMRVINRAIARLPSPFEILVTDGLSQYIGIAQDFGRDIIHIRHIHKPPFGRIIISTIQHTPAKIIRTDIATYTNILDCTNMFYTRVSVMEKRKSVKKDKGMNKKGTGKTGVAKERERRNKRGRPKGSKNRPKEIIEAEKKEKLKRKGKVGRPKGSKNKNKKLNGAKKGKKNKKKVPRSVKDYFKMGKYMVYQYNREKGIVIPLWNADPLVAKSLEKCAIYFGGGCITTNYVEQQFSTLKKLIDFRGKRSLNTWKSILLAYFTIREDPIILKDEITRITSFPQIQNRWVRENIYPKSIRKTILSESLKVVN